MQPVDSATAFLPAAGIVWLGGWMGLGLAATLLLLPIAGYAPAVLQEKKAPPMYARAIARTVVQTAGSRGFRLWSLEARALMAHLAEEADAATHRAVGQELAKDFTSGLSPDMARILAGGADRVWRGVSGGY